VYVCDCWATLDAESFMDTSFADCVKYGIPGYEEEEEVVVVVV